MLCIKAFASTTPTTWSPNAFDAKSHHIPDENIRLKKYQNEKQTAGWIPLQWLSGLSHCMH